MITNKHNYVAIDRTSENGQRLYATPDGNRLPSVTTILDRTKPEEKKKALQEWRDRVGHAQAQAITTEAANRGTRMHSYLENYVKNDAIAIRGSNPYSWASHTMAQAVIDQGLKHVDEYWGVEVPLYFPKIYAGTTDLVGVHQGVPAILDFKQTNKPKKEEWIEDYFLQLAAYAEAHNEVHGTNIQKGVIMMCAKPELNPDTMEPISEPVYQQWIIEGDVFAKWRKKWWERVEQYYLTQ